MSGAFLKRSHFLGRRPPRCDAMRCVFFLPFPLLLPHSCRSSIPASRTARPRSFRRSATFPNRRRLLAEGATHRPPHLARYDLAIRTHCHDREPARRDEKAAGRTFHFPRVSSALWRSCRRRNGEHSAAIKRARADEQPGRNRGEVLSHQYLNTSRLNLADG